MLHISVLPYGQGKQVDDEDRDRPADRKVQEQERKAEQGVGFIENMQKREVHHNDAQDEKNEP
jgi:hypothetical protein